MRWVNWGALTLPPPARREGTCFGSAADIVLDPVRMAGRVAQWRCTDRSSRTARKLQAVMGRVSLQISYINKVMIRTIPSILGIACVREI